MELCICSVAVTIFDSNCDWKESNFCQTCMQFFNKKMWRFIDFCVRLWIFRSSIWSSREKTKNKMNNIKVSLRNNLFSPVKINSKASNIFDEIIHTVAVICWFGLIWFGLVGPRRWKMYLSRWCILFNSLKAFHDYSHLTEVKSIKSHTIDNKYWTRIAYLWRDEWRKFICWSNAFILIAFMYSKP